MSNTTKKIDVPTLSDRDMELLICGLRSIDGGFPKVDFNKLAEMAGFKNANSASVSFGHVRKKVLGDAIGAKPGSKKSTPSKRKKEATADDADESPAKKLKTPTKKSVKKEQDTKQDSDEDEGAAFV